MGEEVSARALRVKLERGEGDAAELVPLLANAAIESSTRSARLEACRLLGDIAGRALGAEWEAAERAAFSLLDAARVADTAADRRGVISAMGRGFRNIWLLPFIHRRLSDKDPTIAAAALDAAGGLGFPALEEAVAAFVSEAAPVLLRRAAVSALGRMGATSAVDRLVPLIESDAADASIALAALTEIRSPAGRTAALAVLEGELEPEVQIAAVRYLAELGALEVLPMLRRLARSEDAEIRIASSLASRALKAERDRDAGERFLVALSEPDRAVRSVLARRLRTLAVKDVLEQAEVLLGEDAAGVVQILGEIRDPEITRYLLALAARDSLPIPVRARAIGSIEADQQWERDELAKVAHDSKADASLRASAIQAMGAFATSTELLDKVADLAKSPAPAIRGALLWALQLARRPADRSDAAKIAEIVEPMLGDADRMVRRRAIYVAGNLNLDKLAAALAKCLAITGDETGETSASTSGQFSSAAISIPDILAEDIAGNPPDIRLAACVALGELGMPGVIDKVVAAIRREDDPRVLGAASNALISAAPQPAQLSALAGRVQQLLKDKDARLREAGAEMSGLLGGAVAASALTPLAADDSPSVRGAAVWALGKLADAASEKTLLGAFDDDDETIHERAAAGLLRLGTPAALAQAIRFSAGHGDPAARLTIASALHVPPAHAEKLTPVIDSALSKVNPDDPVFESLVRLKLATHVTQGAQASAIDVDAEITTVFPSFAQLAKLPGFDQLVKSLRTAESLFQTTANQTDADLSPPITLWMKVLENYVHAWLGPRMAGLQRDPATLFDYVDRVIGGSWNGYARWIEPKWKDPAEVGTAKVDIPLRSIPNAVRELQDRKRKRLDSPLSVTEWARMMVLFAVDHPSSGFRNLFKLGGKS
ncbi:MAG TPA: HEAT repeat domain-containing protein, partial [Kofleriaceae bacterium]|nr:HEAT repeat domain-containing protein [Kofleriaceae bacterium]